MIDVEYAKYLIKNYWVMMFGWWTVFILGGVLVTLGLYMALGSSLVLVVGGLLTGLAGTTFLYRKVCEAEGVES